MAEVQAQPKLKEGPVRGNKDDDDYEFEFPATSEARAELLKSPSPTLGQPTQLSSEHTPFSRRSNIHKVVASFNETLSEKDTDEAEEDSANKRGQTRRALRCRVDVLGSALQHGTRFMYSTVDKMVSSVEQRMTEWTHALKSAGKRPTYMFQACQDEVLVVGRICCDSEGLHSRLNDKAVLLEGSSEAGGGERVRLDLRDLPSFSIFPGQVVGVEGKNPSGHCLVAARLYDSLPPAGLVSSAPGADAGGADSANEHGPLAKRLRRDEESSSIGSAEPGEPFRMMVAAGPFTTSDSLRYEPLEELLALARQRKPDVLFLVGPFVEREHPLIKSGAADRPFLHIFQEEVRDRVEKYCEAAGERARVVIMPSTRDCHLDPVFPQPAMDPELFEDPDHQITVLPNPGIISCNGVSIACTSMDALHNLSSQEVSRTVPGAPGADRMARLACHILGQRSFYPLFPPPPGTNLDFAIAPDALKLSGVPDILILPSTLNHFIKVLTVPELPGAKEEVRATEANSPATGPDPKVADLMPPRCRRSLCINPGRLSKGAGGGTLACIEVLRKDLVNSPAIEFPASVESRTKVEILRV